MTVTKEIQLATHSVTKENKIFVITETSRHKILGIVRKRPLLKLEYALYSTKTTLVFVQDTHPDSGFAVNLFRCIMRILGSFSKLVEISASVWVRQFSQKYLLSPLKCSIRANWDKAHKRLSLSWAFFGVGENAFGSFTLASFWMGTLTSWKLSYLFLASSHVRHFVWWRSCPWNKSSKGLECWLVLSVLFNISFSVSWRFTSKLHRNSWASCWRLSSNMGFCFLKIEAQSSVPVNFFSARGHAFFQGGRTKYSTLIYKSTLANCRFRLCWVR